MALFSLILIIIGFLVLSITLKLTIVQWVTARQKEFAKRYPNTLAKNVVEWVSDIRFLNYRGAWDETLLALVDITGEYCPKCKVEPTHATSVQELTLLEHGHCPDCSYFLPETKSNHRKYFTLPWGRSTGKSTILALLQGYLCHRLLHSPNIGKNYLPNEVPICSVVTGQYSIGKHTLDLTRDFLLNAKEEIISTQREASVLLRNPKGKRVRCECIVPNMREIVGMRRVALLLEEDCRGLRELNLSSLLRTLTPPRSQGADIKRGRLRSLIRLLMIKYCWKISDYEFSLPAIIGFAYSISMPDENIEVVPRAK